MAARAERGDYSASIIQQEERQSGHPLAYSCECGDRMINQNEIRRIAGSLGVDPRVIDHDYVLGCFLHYLSQQDEVKKSWMFKGGTSLAKCHFQEYRFSEDIDFTALEALTETALLRIVDAAKKMMQESIGIRTDFQDTKVDVIQDDYGQESFEAKLHYQGAWEYGGSSRSLQVHVNRDETIVFPPQKKLINHNFSDKEQLPTSALQVYSLEEVLVEKLRAFSGQRKFAIARDLFDLHHLSQHGVNVQAAVGAFEIKCQVKGIDTTDLSLQRILDRKEEYQANWKNQLDYLIPKELKVPFEVAWNESLNLIREVIR
jgi:predicted nucleotidyltransferase component of viral defense system